MNLDGTIRITNTSRRESELDGCVICDLEQFHADLQLQPNNSMVALSGCAYNELLRAFDRL